MDYVIRRVVEMDNPELSKMIRAVFLEHDAPQYGTVYSDPTTDDLFRLFQQPRSALWVAGVEGKAKGCCGIYPTPGLPDNYVELVKYYLAKDARGIGIGHKLMEKCVDCARFFGYSHLYLESLPHFSKAISIYEKQGFKMLEKPLGNSGHTSCNIWMVKEL